jgi:hypothetical protein
MESLIFRHALDIEVATLQAQHPILADALGRAHALLLDGKVFPCEDGLSAEVGSSTDPAVSYLVNGSCPCAASQFHAEPCKHRLAFRLYQRVVDHLTAEEECYTVDLAPEEVPPPVPLPEAPASVNVRLLIGGRDCQLTLRDTDEVHLLARLEAVLGRFPVEMASPSVAAPPQPPVCKYHGAMKASSKAPGSFYCTKKLHDGSYCGERFPEKGGSHA